MKFFFLKIYHFFDEHRSALWFTLLLVVALCVLSALRLHFVEDIGSFLPNNRENKRINEAYQHLGGDNKLVISIAMKDTASEADLDLLSSVADRMAEKLTEADTSGLIKQVRYQVDDQEVEGIMSFVLDNLPYFLTDEDYRRMDTLVTPEHIAAQLATDRQLLASPVPMMRPMIQRDPLFFSSNVLQALSEFKLDDSYQTDNEHIFSKDGKEAQVIVTSNYPLSETKRNGQLVHLIDQTMREVELQQGSVRISCFGASQVSLTNSKQIKKDSFMAIGIALLFIVALLYYYYRNFRSILMILVSISFGALFALGFIAFVKNPVSIIAIGVASIILGIAINYPIHFLSHFKRTDDKTQILKDIVNPLLIGNITTVGAFLSLLFISSDAMKDLGLFSALLLAGTILFVLIFLPHLTGKHFQDTNRDLAFRQVAEFRFENIRGLFWIIIALTIVFYIFSSRTSFDTDMHHINYMTKEQQASFDKLRAESDTTVNTVYVIAEGKTLDEALSNQETALGKLTLVDSIHPSAIVRYSGIGHFIPSQETQRQRLAQWNAFWEGRREAFFADLDQAALRNGFDPRAFVPCKEVIARTYRIQDNGFFLPIWKPLATNYIVQTEDKVMIYNILKVKKENSENIDIDLNRILEHDNGFAFTDTSIASRLVEALSSDFNYVLYICGIIVFAFLLFSFGRLEISLMAFLPLFIAWIWILGIMGMTGIRFNIVNIILATFIFGMGDDYSIFVTEGLLYEYAYGRKMLAQFKNSIILSASIMFISIGMLVFAKHPAMRSLAQVTIIGMFSVVMMAYIIPPLVFKWLTMRKGKPRRQPVTLRSLFTSVIGFPYFFFGVLVLSAGGFFWLVLGKRNDANKLKYHKLLRKLLYSTARVIPNSSFTIDNPLDETFEKPAVIVSNHQSHFDLMYLLMLHPKIIVLTNDWAWNTPLYRRIVRNADFLPASYGLDSNFPKIKQMIDKGYSVLVFPEGTRSFDHEILRFHQGAFHLADKMGLDILPIIMHGIGDMFPKHDTCIHRGIITISIRERIRPNDADFRNGKTTLETSRLFRRYFTQEFAALKEHCETPEYLKDIVYHNYIYKGKAVEVSCRRKLVWVQELVDALAPIPDGSRVLYKHCGNGELSLTAALLRKHIDVTAYDADDNCIALASHCFSVPENLHYTSELPNESSFDFVIDEQDLLSSITEKKQHHVQ